MDDDSLATVIPFPLHRLRHHAPLPDTEPDRGSDRGSDQGPDVRRDGTEQYWALVQSLAAERRALVGGAG